MSYAGGIFSSADPKDRKYRKYSDSILGRRLLRYILRYKRNLSTVVLTLLVTSSVGVIGPALLGWSVNDVLGRDMNSVIFLVSVYFAINLASYFADNRRTYHMQVLGQNIIRDIRKEAFEKLQRLSVSYYSKRETGRIMSYITNDVDALSDFVTFQLPQVLAGFVLIASIIVFMFYFNYTLTLVSLIIIFPLVVLTLAFQGRIQSSFVETRKKIAMVTAKLQEGISGVRVTQSLVREDEVSQNFDEVNAENLQANLRANKLTSIFNALVQVIEAFGIALVLWFGANEILSGAISVGTLVIFLLYVNAFFTPIIQLTTFYNSYQSAVTGLDRVLQVLDTEIEVKEPDDSKKFGSQVEVGSEFPELEFRNVTFGYEADQPIIKNVSFKVAKKQTIAIVGPTGAGKSSIVNLMLRLYDPQEGEIRIEGLNLKDVGSSDLRRLFGVIPQDPFLFSTSILENIRYGRPDATEEMVIKVAKKIGADDFIRLLPQGYHAQVSEGGANLSMGQKQMICFARAFLLDPNIVVMDEATSGVDPLTELRLQRSLPDLLKARTTIIIAHRLSTIRLADRIIVLESGRIAEEGTFSELLSQENGIFAKMYAMQQMAIR